MQEERLIPLENLPGTFEATGWKPLYYMEFEQWERVGEALRGHRRQSEVEHSTRLWQLADWLNYGEGFFGERHAQALEASDLRGESLKDVSRCGAAFPWAHRQHPAEVSFWMHDECVSVPEPRRYELVAEAAEEGYSRKELRAFAAQARADSKQGAEQISFEADPDPDPHADTCPLCEGAGKVSADRRIGYLKEEGLIS